MASHLASTSPSASLHWSYSSAKAPLIFVAFPRYLVSPLPPKLVYVLTYFKETVSPWATFSLLLCCASTSSQFGASPGPPILLWGILALPSLPLVAKLAHPVLPWRPNSLRSAYVMKKCSRQCRCTRSAVVCACVTYTQRNSIPKLAKASRKRSGDTCQGMARSWRAKAIASTEVTGTAVSKQVNRGRPKRDPSKIIRSKSDGLIEHGIKPGAAGPVRDGDGIGAAGSHAEG